MIVSYSIATGSRNSDLQSCLAVRPCFCEIRLVVSGWAHFSVQWCICSAYIPLTTCQLSALLEQRQDSANVWLSVSLQPQFPSECPGHVGVSVQEPALHDSYWIWTHLSLLLRCADDSRGYFPPKMSYPSCSVSNRYGQFTADGKPWARSGPGGPHLLAGRHSWLGISCSEDLMEEAVPSSRGWLLWKVSYDPGGSHTQSWSMYSVCKLQKCYTYQNGLSNCSGNFSTMVYSRWEAPDLPLHR